MNMRRIGLGLLIAGGLGLGSRTAHAQNYSEILTSPSGSLHSWFGTSLASIGDTLVIGDPEYRANAGTCPIGHGAVSVYKKVNGAWTFNQRFLATPGIQENKLGAAVAMSGNILIASAEREDLSSTVFRTGAIFVYKRSSSTASYQFKSRLFPPNATGQMDFTNISGIATNGTYIVGAELNKIHVYRILTDGTATFATTIIPPHAGVESVALTSGNVLAFASNGDAGIFAYQLAQSGSTTTATAINTSAISPAGSKARGGLAADGNTVVVAKQTTTAPNNVFFQFVKFTTGAVQSYEDRYLPHGFDNAGWNNYPNGAQHMSFRENDGLFVGYGSGQNMVLGFKHTGSAYNYAGMISNTQSPWGINDPNFGAAVAYNGTELFVSDPHVQTWPGGGDPCGSPNQNGKVHVFTPRKTVPTGPGSSKELASWLYAQDYDAGNKVATNGTFVASGSAYAYQGKNHFGEVTLYQNVSGSWRQIEKYIAPDAGFTGFGSSVDLNASFLVMGAASAKNPNNLVQTGVVYTQQFASGAFGRGPWHGWIAPPSGVGASSQFGASVALDGNVLVVGAPGVNNKGAAYVYEWTGSFWSGPKTLLPSANGTDFEEFGTSVAAFGSYIVVGAPYRDFGRIESGAVQFFRKNSSGNYVTAGEFAVPTNVNGQVALGRSAAMGQYYTIVGAPDFNAVLYRRVSGQTTWQQDTVLAAPSESGYGEAVTIQGTTFLVGATYSQRVHRYVRGTSSVSQTGLLIGSNNFGGALDSWNDGTSSFAVIGDYDALTNGTNSGAAYFLNFTNVQ